MSNFEIVKKFVIQLDYELKGKDKLTQYNNTSKEIAKNQKESNKATEKGLTLKQKEKELLKQDTALKKQALIEEGKLKAKAINEETKLRLEQIRGVSSAKRKALTDEEKAEKERNARLQKENKARQKELEKRQKELEKESKKRAENIEKEVKRELKLKETNIQKEKQARDKLRNDINARNNMQLATQEGNFQKQRERERLQREQDRILRERQQIKEQQDRDRRRYAEGGLVQRTDAKLQRAVNERLKPQGKQMLPNGQIVPIPPKEQPKKPFMDKESVGQMALDTGKRIGDKTQDIIMGSLDIMLEYEQRLNELKVRGELTPKQLKDIDTSVKDTAQRWGTDILETQKIGIELGKTGLQGDMLKFMIEESTMLARSFGVNPQLAKDVLNTVLHQQRQNIQSPEAYKKNIPITQDKEAIKKASNMLSAAVNFSALDAKDLMVYLKYSGTGAGDKGISFEEYLNNAMIYSNISLLGSTPGTSQRKIQQRLYQGLSNVIETENFKVGKKKGKKGNMMEKAYNLRDYIDKDTKKYAGRDKEGRKYFRPELMLTDIVTGMIKKKASDLDIANVMEEIGGLTALEAVTALTKIRSYEDKKARKALQDAQKRDETRKTATALMQNPKSQLEQTKTKKDIAMINFGKKFEPEFDLFRTKSNQMLDAYNKSPQQQQASKGLGYVGVGTGIASAIGTGLAYGGVITGATAGMGVLGVASGLVLLHDSIAKLKGDPTIIGGLSEQINILLGIKGTSTADAINQTKNAISSLSKTLEQATAGIEQFLPSYLSLEKLGVVNLGVNVVPYGPGKAPDYTQPNSPRYFMQDPYAPHTSKMANANKTTAKKKG